MPVRGGFWISSSVSMKRASTPTESAHIPMSIDGWNLIRAVVRKGESCIRRCPLSFGFSAFE